MRRAIVVVASVCAALLAGAESRAQYTDYSQAYKSMLRGNPGVNAGTDRYLYNKYYAGNPAVSPYISGAVLGGTDYGTGYYSVTRPELQRREANAVAQAQYVQQRKLQGNVGHTAYPGAGFMWGSRGTARVKPVPPAVSSPGAYHNHWYGNWAR